MSYVNVIGLGYIGLPTALMLAAKRVKVVGTDYNSEVVSSLQRGEVTFEEKGLPELFAQAQANITFATEYIKTDLYIIAVPTPYIKESKQIDPSYVINAVSTVLEVCEENTIIAIESTISPGTIDKFVRPLVAQSGRKVHLVHTPERILPGNMIYELEYNARTIGCDNIGAGEIVRLLYAKFCQAEIVLTDIKTAEISKVVENTYRDINIAFANELCKICHREGIDVYEVINISNLHPRVNILNPGPGVGGHCISVDPWFLVGDYPDLVNIILAARQVNDTMPDFVIERLAAIMKENELTDIRRVGLYGLAYKENVDDVRESPSLQLIAKLERHIAFGIKSYDPHIKERIVFGQYHDFDEFLSAIDLLVVMVGHDHIKENQALLQDKVIFDTRNVLQFSGVYRM